MLVIWLGLVMLFGMMSHNFLSERTFVTLGQSQIPRARRGRGGGMTLVLIIGGIDLSAVGCLDSAGRWWPGPRLNFHLPFWAAILLGLGVGLARRHV